MNYDRIRHENVFTPVGNLTLILFVAGMIVLACSHTKSSTGKAGQNASFTPEQALQYEGLVNRIPEDGQAHIIYRSPDGNEVIKVIAITIGNSYTTHVVWVEQIGNGSGGGHVEHVATH